MSIGKVAIASVAVIGLAAVSSAASAGVFTIEDFAIKKGTNTIYDDTFDTGLAPPDAPNFTNGNPTNYLTTGTFSENHASGGSVAMDTSLGGIVSSATGIGFKADFATLNSNIDPLNTTLGLKRLGGTFSVTGTFDLSSLPTLQREGFGVRLTDRVLGGPQTQPGDDSLDLVVQFFGGQVEIRMFEQDFVAGTTTQIAAISLSSVEQIGDNLISLSLSRDNAATNDITASYALSGSVSPNSGTLYLGSTGNPDAQIFNGEEFTRAAFVAYEPYESVPEPAGLGVLALGGALAFLRRRRKG